jgi:ABC-type polysaccharide/polyol phosphate export permease
MSSPGQSAPRIPAGDVADRYSVFRALGEIARELSAGRELTRQLTVRDLRIRYKQAVFGMLWAVLMPGLIVLSGLIIRFAIAQMTATTFDRSMAASLAVKSVAWGFFVGGVGLATPTLLANNNLVTKIYFPREVLPLSSILTQTIDSGIGVILLILALPFLDVHLSVAQLWVPVLVVLLICLTSAAALLFSCANAFFRDVKYLVQMFLQFGIFFSPVFFEPQSLGPIGAKLVMLNPVAPLLQGFSLAIVRGHNLLTPLTIVSSRGQDVAVWEPWYLAYTAVFALGGLVVSALIFHRAEGLYAEYV